MSGRSEASPESAGSEYYPALCVPVRALAKPAKQGRVRDRCLSMLDTIEIPLPSQVYFRKPVTEVIDAMRAPDSEIRYSGSKHYRAVLDLRQYTEQDAFLYLYSKNTGRHKVVFIDAGEKTKGQMLDTLAGIVEGHPEMLETSRVDACANVEGTSVSWFARSVRARMKQWQATFGNIQLKDSGGRSFDLSEMGKRELHGMYIGKRANCFRVYDKLAERRKAYSRELRRHELEAAALLAEKCLDPVPWSSIPKDLQRGFARRVLNSARRMYPFPSFEDWFGSQCTGGMTGVLRQMELPGQEQPEQLSLSPRMAVVIPSVLTRVERQMGAGRVPAEIATVGRLFKNALEFNPFSHLEFTSADPDPVFDSKDFSPIEMLAGFHMRQLLASGDMTYQQLYAFLNLKRNAKRYIRKFEAFLTTERTGAVTSAELYERYRDTVSRQLAA